MMNNRRDILLKINRRCVDMMVQGPCSTFWLLAALCLFGCHARRKPNDSNSSGYTTGSDGLTVSITTDGTYELLVNGKSWLRSANTYMNANNKTYMSSDGTLQLMQTSGTSGSDKLGQWQSTTFSYQTSDEAGIRFNAVIKNYPALPLVIFQQVYLDGANGTQASTIEGICAGFPGFKVDADPGMLGFLSYGGLMFGDTGKKMGSWQKGTSNINDGITGGPLAIFDQDGNTLVFSPYNNFMSASFSLQATNGGTYYGGIMGGVSEIPPMYTQEFIIFYGAGINKAFNGWGQVMRYRYDKDASMQQNDLTVSHLGYYTDNGAFYYYHTEMNKTYEQTLYDVKDYFTTQDIPYNYIQYDSWWYFKGKGNGVKNWTARNDIFPDGFPNVAQRIGLPSAAHNRYWSPDTVYAKQNGGRYDFIVEQFKSLPITEEFWSDLFIEAKRWNLIMYEQDWLNVEFSGLDHLTHNLSLGAQWLTQMAQAADDHGIFIQYCMANPRHAMQALLYPRVTQARVSNDYHPGGTQWKIGISSIFAAAMGVAPYKDTFWSTETQPGNPYSRTEPNWKLNIIVSTLSTGPVGPSDMMGGTNVSMVMKCCNQDGLILKPMFPLMAIDAQIVKAAFPDTDGPDGEVWISYSDFNGLIFTNLLVVDLKNGTSYVIHPYDIWVYNEVTETGMLLAVPYDEPEGWTVFSNDTGLSFSDKFNPTRPALYHISPQVPGWPQTAVFGDLDKWAPMSPQRVTDFRWDDDSIVASLKGSVGETFDFWFVLNTKLGSVTCQINSRGSGTFTISKNTGTATC